MTQSAELVATVSWSAEKRKLNAVKACGERDGAALVGLLHAYVRAEEKKGFRTSPATLQTYTTGLLRWIDFCWPDRELPPRIRILRASRDDVQGFLG